MKNYTYLLLAALLFFVMTTSFNKQIFDFKFHFHTAMIRMPDGEVLEVKVRKWNDYENSDQIQVISEDGKTYLVHSANIILIGD